jgi:DNA-binding MarR family transcriptional regulator
VAESDVVDSILEQWRRERPDLDVAPMDVIGRVSRLARGLEARPEPATLRRSGPPFRLRASHFSRALMLTASGATKRLDRLEQAGLISRLPDPGDRRGILIALTPKGRRLVDKAVVAHVDNEHRLLSGLTKDEQRQLAGLLRKLGLSLRD